MFDNEFIESIPDDLFLGASFIIEEFYEFHEYHNHESIENHDQYMEFYHLLEAFLASKKYEFSPLEITGDLNGNLNKIIDFFVENGAYFRDRLTKEKASFNKERYQNLFSKSFMYEFTDGDLERIQMLINELREIIVKSELFESKHQSRLLKRLERLQSELHKKVSDLDRFWGLVGDAGVAIGKFGNDAKPIVDRIHELTRIVWNTQVRSEELPSETSMPKILKEESSENDD